MRTAAVRDLSDVIEPLPGLMSLPKAFKVATTKLLKHITTELKAIMLVLSTSFLTQSSVIDSQQIKTSASCSVGYAQADFVSWPWHLLFD
jgi:hypothetical protein